MLPLQITLEGFMSYRDPTTISFEGASLWMLAGGNGAGKSTVFDAMRWTLFGAHRGGRSGNEALIHRDREKLRVAFDLGLGDARFRLLRTLSRTGRSTWQIEKLSGAEAGKVPETDSRDGYETWLHQHIGLSDETFCAAMYLAQGRGDAILSANPQQRYEMLREIVDISAFAALHERAKSRSAELENAARASERAWQLAPDAAAEEIEVLGESLRDLSEQIAQRTAQREEILRLEPLAMQWQNLELQREIAQKSLDAMRFHLQDAPQIERDFARLVELETLLPPLENYAQTRARLSQNARQIESFRLQLLTKREELARLELELQSAQTRRDAVESAQKQREAARLEALLRLGEIAPQLAGARQIALYEDEIAALENEIAAFPADWDAQIAALKMEVERAQNHKIAAEILQRFAREKAGFQSALQTQNAAEGEIERFESALADEGERVEKTIAQQEMTRETQTRAVQNFSAAKARRLNAQAARTRFDEVRGASNCYFCGQALTSQHAENELKRLEGALQSTTAEEKDASAALESQNHELKNAEKELESAQNALRTVEKALEKARGRVLMAQNSVRQTCAKAAAILGELSAEFAALLDQNSARDWDDTRVLRVLEGDSPTLNVLENLQSEAEKLDFWNDEVRVWNQKDAARREIAARLSDRNRQLAPLRERWNNTAPAELERLESALQLSLQEAISGLQSGAALEKAARETVAGLENSRAAAQTEISSLESQIVALSAAQIEISRALEAASLAHLVSFFALDELSLEAELTRLQSERSRLGNDDLRARAAALKEAQNQFSEAEREVSRLEQAIQNLPVEAQRAPALLQNEANNFKAELEKSETARGELQLKKAELERQRDAKKSLEAANLNAQNAARQHKTLADLLGPHQLQRFLLREAENGILDEANATLDRLSSGTLRLELRADDEEIAGARKTALKVLDFAVFRADDAGSGAGMLPAFLSGSQRFRVAVSLALGIGRYATRGGGTRLEAVIIDEGFGSLDKIGRGEMIDELKSLGSELKRVILVSHQEEFAEAFPNRYLIENDGISSTARLMAN